MIIAVNARCLVKDDPGGCSNFMNEVFSKIAKLHKEHIFILIFDKPCDLAFPSQDNVIPVVTGPYPDTALKCLIWNNVKIPRILKKYKADVFVSPGFCSLTTKVPQCLILHDLSFLYFRSVGSRKYLSFYEKNMPQFLQKAATAIAFSEFSKADIIKHYKTPHHKIQVAYAGSNENFRPIGLEERQSIKEKYTNGKEYFVYVGAIVPLNNLMNLLKAFSAFKKRQKSGMCLLMASESGITYPEFAQSLRLFRFRKDVNLLINLSVDEIAKITASAYAMVYPAFHEDLGSSLLNAMRCEVPVLTSSTAALPEICGDAALYADPGDFNGIALKMMQIYKDEKLRKELIEKGKEHVQKFQWDNTARIIWDTIEKTVDAGK